MGNVAMLHWTERCEGFVRLCNLPVSRWFFSCRLFNLSLGRGLRIALLDPFVHHSSSHDQELQLRGSFTVWPNGNHVTNPEIQVPLISFLCCMFRPNGYGLYSFFDRIQEGAGWGDEWHWDKGQDNSKEKKRPSLCDPNFYKFSSAY